MNQKDRSKQEYKSRINQVMDYIETNLDQPIDLHTLSSIAHFSPYHFHRIFTFLTGETPNNFLLRVRIEKAAHLLLKNDFQKISEIAYKCGFNNVSTFSRTFRKYFDMSAQEYRSMEKAVFSKGGVQYSKNGKVLSKIGQKDSLSDAHLCSVEFKNLLFMDAKIEIKRMPDIRVIYCRHTGQFNEIHKAYEKLMKWAGPRGLLSSPEVKTITVYHDDPSITSIEKVRQDACITVTEDVKTEGEIGKATIKGGNYAVGRFEITDKEFDKAWNSMCLWFTESGYQPAEGNPYEFYHNDHTQHPERKFIVDLCIPVKPL